MNIGDKATVRTDLVIGGVYGNCEFVAEMQDFSGNVVTIIEVIEYRPGKFNYKILEDKDIFTWNEEMFEEGLTL